MLLTPGPTAVPEFVRAAMSVETLHHRTQEFELIFKNTRKLLKEILNMEEVLMLSCSGTGAMEACLTNLTKNKTLTINSGKFGERFTKIAIAHNINYKELKYEWNTPADIEDIRNILNNDKDIDSICIQVCESAGGLRHPIEEIAKVAKNINSNIIIIADGITAVGVEKIDTSNIDALITGSQKALMLPPGLAMIGLSSDAIKKLENNHKGFYLNLFTEIKKQRLNTTAWTAATTLIIGLETILLKLKKDGFDKLYANTKKRAFASREALKNIGLDIYPKSPANSMTTIYFDDADKLRKILKDKFDVNIAGGQDHLKGKIFRINHMGLVKDYEAMWVLNSVEMVLDELGIRKFDGKANQVFMELFYK